MAVRAPSSSAMASSVEGCPEALPTVSRNGGEGDAAMPGDTALSDLHFLPECRARA